MSADEEKAKPSVCENFEPQAWRKTICKNCFQAPEKHVPGGGAEAPGSGGKENKPPAVAEKPKPGSKQGVEDKNVGQKGEKDKPGTALANSIKDKYEQLEKDKHGQKEPPKVAPKSVKVKPGVSSIADKQDKTKGDSKSNENIPSSQNKTNSATGSAPGQRGNLFSKKEEQPSAPKTLNKSKFGSVENVSKIDEKRNNVDTKIGHKSKFGSMENLSKDKSKEPIQIPIQRSKFGGSIDTLSSKKETQPLSKSELSKRTLLNNLDTFSNEMKAGATSKVGSTVIHKQTDGKIDVITIPKKSNVSKQLDNESLQNEMNELKMSRVGDKSGQIKPQQDPQNKYDVKSKVNQSVENKQSTIGTSSPKSVSPERKPGFKLDIGKTDESVDIKLARRNSGFKLSIGSDTESPEIKPGFKLDFRKSESPTKDPKRRNSGFKLEIIQSESPTKEPLVKSPEKKTGFKLTFDKSESPTKDPQGEKRTGFKIGIASSPSPTKDVQHTEDKSKVDLRSGLRKAESKRNEPSKIDLAKSEGKQKFELPQLKSSKEKKDSGTESDKETRNDIKTDHTDTKSENKQNDTLKTDLNKATEKSKFEVPVLKSAKGKIEDQPKDSHSPSKEVEKRTDQESKKKSNDNAHTINVSPQKESVNSENKTTEDSQNDKSINETRETAVSATLSIDIKSDKDDKGEKEKANDKNDNTFEVNSISDSNGDFNESKKENKIDTTCQKSESNDQVSVKIEHNQIDESGSKHDIKSANADKLDSNEKHTTKQEDGVKGKFDFPKLKSNKTDITDTITNKSETGRTKFDSNKTKMEITDNKHKQDDKNTNVGKKEEPKKKVESPFLKSNKSTENDAKKAAPETKSNRAFEVPKLKSAKADENDAKHSKPESKFSKGDEPKRKFELPTLKSNKDDKDKKIDKKLDSKQEEPKRKFEVPSLKSNKDEKDKNTAKRFDTKQDEPKRKFEVPSLKSNKDEKDKKTDKKEETKPDEQKQKFEMPNLKSSKQDEKGKITNKLDLKSDDKKKSYEVPKLKSAKVDEVQKKDDKSSSSWKKDEPKKKFELPSLKSTKEDDRAKSTEKQGVKSRNEEPKNTLGLSNLKSIKDDNKLEKSKAVEDNKKTKDGGADKPTSKTFEMPKLKSKQDQHNKETKSEDIAGSDSSQKDTKDISKTDTSRDPVDTFHTKHKGADERDKPGSAPVGKTKIHDAPSPSAIGAGNFEIVSADSGVNALIDEEDHACANDSASDGNYLHVDTQVFTSSRNKTAGVTGIDESSLAKPGVSDSLITTKESKEYDSLTSADSHSSRLHNGERSPVRSSELISSQSDTDKSIKSELRDDSESAKETADEIARLKKELLLMTERCRALQKENIALVDDLDKKDDDQIVLKRQKDEVESLIKDLKGKVDTVVRTCEQLETDNKNLTNSLKAQVEQNEVNEELIRKEEQKQESEEEGANTESAMEEMLEENEQLKQEIVDLKLEMDEMYDSFRDQEFEEFRELQKELEITAKNCRILQFKVRKMERHNEQVEHDRNQFEDRLRRLQDQFADRDAVSHIHSLEDELRMAKDVSVRLHDELDLVEEKRGKMEEENRHLTELLEQADRKQFRLELEVDKLRDKVMQLRTELNTLKDGGEPRKASLEVIGRQGSQENEIQQLKRELYDGKEREMDLKDQLQILEDNSKASTKRVIDLEDENENLSSQLKKLSYTSAFNENKKTGNAKPETDVELRIQFEMAEKDLTCLRRKLADLDEENEMLHEEVFALEMRLKEKDKQLNVIPEPKSPSAYYEEKIKEYEKEANEFRSKLLNKDQDIEQLYAQLKTVHNQYKRGRDLRKSKSLDWEMDYGTMVDLKRQLELSQQECIELRERLSDVQSEIEDYKYDLESLKETINPGINSNELTGLAVAYIEMEDDNDTQLELAEARQVINEFRNRITHLADKCISFAKLNSISTDPLEFGLVDQPMASFSDSHSVTLLPTPQNDSILKTNSKNNKTEETGSQVGFDSENASVNFSINLTGSRPSGVLEDLQQRGYHPSNLDISRSTPLQSNIQINKSESGTESASLTGNSQNSPRPTVESRENESGNETASFTGNSLLPRDESRGNESTNESLLITGNASQNSRQTRDEARGTLYLLSTIDDIFSKLVHVFEMESGGDNNKNVVPTSINKRETCEPPETEYGHETEVNPSPSSGESDCGQSPVDTRMSSAGVVHGDGILTGVSEPMTSVSPDIAVTMVTDLDVETDDNLDETEDSENDSNASSNSTDEPAEMIVNESVLVVDISTDQCEHVQASSSIHCKDTISSADSSECHDTKPPVRKEASVTQTLLDTIRDLEERIDDLRYVVRTKEEKNILLEDEVQDLEELAKKVQAESRRREMELLQEMDLIHGKNEILNNLIEIVKDRAETAEDELERIITEINESQDSPPSSEKNVSRANSVGRVSDGSDEVFDGSPAERPQSTIIWEEQFKKRIRSLETLLAEERKKVSSLEKKLEITGSDVISSAMSDDAKLHMREKELLQSELKESQKHAVMANEQIRSLTEKLKKVETQRWGSPKNLRKSAQISSSSNEEMGDSTTTDNKSIRDQFCKTCSELQSVKDQLCDELIRFKEKAEELEIKVEEINDIWVSKSAVSEKERQALEQKLRQRIQDCKKLEDLLNKQREEDRVKDIFLKERDNALKERASQIARKEELISEQEDIIRQREEDLQSLFDQISQREKSIKDLTEALNKREEQLKEKDNAVRKLHASIEEKTEELHYLEEEVQESTKKRKESETIIAEMQEKIEETLKGEKSEIETENERLQSDLENLMGNVTELHQDKMTLQTELDKAKQALSEAMLMWDRDRSSLGSELSKASEKLGLFVETSNKKESVALQTMRREVHSIIDTKEKLAHELRLTKMDYDNQIRILKTEKFKLTEELTSKIRMLAHEMTNNDKMTDELKQLRGQDDINFQLHHHEKILRAEYLAMKVRYETQLERLQKEHLQLLTVVERLQKEKNLDQEIIVGIQRGMANIKETYTYDLTRWKDERNILESHISQIEEGKEIAMSLRSQIDALKRQLVEQEMERSDLVNKMTTERRDWDMEKASLTSKINQLEEQLAVFIQVQSKSKDVQYRMEITWEKEREDQKRLLAEAHSLAIDLQEQLHRRDEEHARERNNLLDQIEKHRKDFEDATMSKQKMNLEMNTGESKAKRLDQQLEEVRDRLKHESSVWMGEKAELLRRLADIRKIHMRYVRRTDDVLSSLKRLRELAAIVAESDTSATLPSNGVDAGSASAAAAPSAEPDISNVKQNIDQVILKYVKESLRQLHFASEELARPPMESSRDERQKIRRSLSSSEIELLKDELLLGPNGNPQTPEADKYNRDKSTLHRQITHDGNGVKSDHLPSDYIENILMEQSTFFNDGKYSNVEIRRIKTGKEVTRTETIVTSLPKPPPSFVIPRSRSKSPSPYRDAGQRNSYTSLPIDTTNYNRLSAPPTGIGSRSSSTDSSTLGNYPSSFVPSSSQGGLLGAGALQSGSLDRLSPSAARRRFFESQSNVPIASSTWSSRGRNQYKENRNSKSLSNSTEFNNELNGQRISANGQFNGPLRSSVSMDDNSITHPVLGIPKPGSSTSKESLGHGSGKHSSGLKDMFNAMKRKLKPKIKRSHSARDHDMLRILEEKEKQKSSEKDDKVHERKDDIVNINDEGKVDKNGSEMKVGTNQTAVGSEGTAGEVDTVKDAAKDDRQTVQEQMTPIKIPDASITSSTGKVTDTKTKDQSRSRSPAKKEKESQQDKEKPSKETTMQKLKKRFRSRSADRARDKPRERHVTPILVGHSTTSTDSSDYKYSETCV